MKKFLFVITFLFSVVSLHAVSTHLVLELKSGEKYLFLIKENSAMVFSERSVVIEGKSDCSYLVENVKGYHFISDEVTATESFTNSDIFITQTDDKTFLISNIEGSSVVYVVDLSGVVLSSVPTDENGVASVTLPQSKGLYIIKVGNNKSFKVLRK
ncbi:MAG: DUF1442 domain-containing protein [Paludibacteraceae bacterium]|nr:DUF1442 domain-containing protein [Paludibacteraceae bacterium]